MLRPCATPHCRAIVEQGYCPAHAKQYEQRRGSAHRRGYDRHRWGRARLEFLIEYPWCGDRSHGQFPVMSQCAFRRLQVVATDVDHVQPHRGDSELFWDRRNWQALCHECHSRKTRAGL